MHKLSSGSKTAFEDRAGIAVDDRKCAGSGRLKGESQLICVMLLITQAGSGAVQAMSNTASAKLHNYIQESISLLSGV